MTGLHRPAHPVRLVTAASLFDGHDASINIMRRILQSQGAEVIHLGHNRSVDEVVDAAVAGGRRRASRCQLVPGRPRRVLHVPASTRCASEGAGHVRVYGGGGGVIVPARDRRAAASTACTIFSPEDGQRLGLARHGQLDRRGVRRRPLRRDTPSDARCSLAGDRCALARAITALEAGTLPDAGARGPAARRRGRPDRTGARHHRHRRLGQVVAHRRAGPPVPPRPGGQAPHRRARRRPDPPQGRRRAARRPHPDERHRRRPQVFFRSLATRARRTRCPSTARRDRRACKAAGFDLVIVETPGIGQGDAAIVRYVDVSLYVMTPEFGAASQLEKIDMLDFADVVAINKFERRGAEDALRDVAPPAGPQPRGVRHVDPRTCRCSAPSRPASTTTASPRSTSTCAALLARARARRCTEGTLAPVDGTDVEPTSRRSCRRRACRYLAEIAETVRGYHARHRRAGRRGRRRQQRRPWSARGCVATERPTTSERRRRCSRARTARRAAERCSTAWPAVERRSRAEPADGRARERRTRLRPRVAVGHARAAGRAAPLHRPRRAAALPARGEPARSLPVHRRRVPVQARGRGPGPHVRRRGRPVPHQPRGSTCSPRASRPPGCRPRSTRSRSTASTPTSGPTSTARSATRACRSPRSTT